MPAQNPAFTQAEYDRRIAKVETAMADKGLASNEMRDVDIRLA